MFKSKLHINPPPCVSARVLLSHFFISCIENIHPQRQSWAECCQICCIHFIQRFIFKTLDLVRVCTWSKRNGRHFWHWSLLKSGNSKYGDRKLTKMHNIALTTHLHLHPSWYSSHLITDEEHLYSADQLHHQHLAGVYRSKQTATTESMFTHLWTEVTVPKPVWWGFLCSFLPKDENRLTEWDTIWKKNKRVICRSNPECNVEVKHDKTVWNSGACSVQSVW